jgi:hypothetical protein
LPLPFSPHRLLRYRQALQRQGALLLVYDGRPASFSRTSLFLHTQ